MGKTYRNVVFDDADSFHGEYTTDGNYWMRFSANMALHHIHVACQTSETAAERIWDEQDGYGEPGFVPVQGWDWSGIRDSTDAAITRMREIAREYVSDAEIMSALGA